MNPVQGTAGVAGSQSAANGQPEAQASLGPWQVSIAGLDKASLLMLLYNRSAPQGAGLFHPLAFERMTLEVARDYTSVSLSFDYVHGRPLKIDLSGDVLDTRLYDRDVGPHAARAIVQALRQAQESGARP